MVTEKDTSCSSYIERPHKSLRAEAPRRSMTSLRSAWEPRTWSSAAEAGRVEPHRQRRALARPGRAPRALARDVQGVARCGPCSKAIRRRAAPQARTIHPADAAALTAHVVRARAPGSRVRLWQFLYLAIVGCSNAGSVDDLRPPSSALAPQGGATTASGGPSAPALSVEAPLVPGQPSERSPDAPEWHDPKPASSRYDFRFEWVPGTEKPVSPGVIERHGILSLHFKGDSAPIQRISVNTWLFDGETPDFRVDDFNFDGHEDFAVHDANSGSYGSPSYSVYLYYPTRGRFERSARSAPFSDLSEASLRFPQTNGNLRRLRTFSKSGCCVHWISEYDVVAGGPRRVKSETEEELADERCLLTIEERAPDGRWTRATRACAQDQKASNSSERSPLPPPATSR